MTAKSTLTDLLERTAHKIDTLENSQKQLKEQLEFLEQRENRLIYKKLDFEKNEDVSWAINTGRGNDILYLSKNNHLPKNVSREQYERVLYNNMRLKIKSEDTFYSFVEDDFSPSGLACEYLLEALGFDMSNRRQISYFFISKTYIDLASKFVNRTATKNDYQTFKEAFEDCGRKDYR